MYRLLLSLLFCFFLLPFPSRSKTRLEGRPKLLLFCSCCLPAPLLPPPPPDTLERETTLDSSQLSSRYQRQDGTHTRHTEAHSLSLSLSAATASANLSTCDLLTALAPCCIALQVNFTVDQIRSLMDVQGAYSAELLRLLLRADSSCSQAIGLARTAWRLRGLPSLRVPTRCRRLT